MPAATTSFLNMDAECSVQRHGNPQYHGAVQGKGKPNPDSLLPASFPHLPTFHQPPCGYSEPCDSKPCEKFDNYFPTFSPSRISTCFQGQFPNVVRKPFYGSTCNYHQANREYNMFGWVQKHPEHWNKDEVLDWIFCSAESRGMDLGRLRCESFQDVSGSQLCKMTQDEFVRREPQFGAVFYGVFKELCKNANFQQPTEPRYQDCGIFEADSAAVPATCRFSRHSIDNQQSEMNISEIGNISGDCTSHFMRNHEVRQRSDQSLMNMSDHKCHYTNFDQQNQNITDSNTSEFEKLYKEILSISAPPTSPSFQCSEMTPVTSPRRRPGRPRIKNIPIDDDFLVKKQDKRGKCQHLWEFIYDTLMNPLYSPKYLKWENHSEGVFRFVHSEVVAQIWGRLKNNENMTYEKLSRAMRHYYRRGILERVEGRRLVYKFSKSAMDRMKARANIV